MSKRKADELAVRIGERLTGALGNTVPRDLNTLAKSLGVIDILYRTRIRHGYTEWTSRGPTIQIALANTDGRRRATLAHECGHLILDPLFRPPSFLNAPVDSQIQQIELAKRVLGAVLPAIQANVPKFDLEYLCDRVAVELMLPASEVPKIAAKVNNLTTLKSASTNYRVSLAMLVIRLNEFGSSHSLLQMERAVSGDWIVSSAIGVPSKWRGRVVSKNLSVGLNDKQRDRHLLTLETNDSTIHVCGNVGIVGRNRAIVFLPTAAFENQSQTFASSGVSATGLAQPLRTQHSPAAGPLVVPRESGFPPGCTHPRSRAMPDKLRLGRSLPPAAAAGQLS